MNAVRVGRWKLWAYLAIALTGQLAYGVPSADSLDRAKEIFAKRLAQIQKEFDDASSEQAGTYGRALENLRQAVQKRGELEPLQAILAEQKRFEADGKVRTADLNEDVSALKEIQSRYLAVSKKTWLDRDQDLLVLSRKYVAHLSSLQKEFTKAGELELAVDCKKEIDSISARIELLEGEAAAETAEPPPEQQPPTSTEGVPPESPMPSLVAVTPSKDGTKAGSCMAYLGSGPSLSGTLLTKVALRRTSRARLARGVMVSVSSGELDASKGSSRSSHYNDYYYPSSSYRGQYAEATIVRTHIRCLEPQEKLQVVIKLFTRNIARKGNITPTQAGSYRTVLSSVGTEGVCLDCPPIATSRVRRSSYDYGTEFYGASITVFDGSGDVVYEACSPPSLEETTMSTSPELSGPELAEALRLRYEELRQAYTEASRKASMAPQDAEAQKKRDEAYEAYQAAQREYYNREHR